MVASRSRSLYPAAVSLGVIARLAAGWGGMVTVGEKEQQLRPSIAALSSNSETGYRKTDDGWIVCEDVVINPSVDEVAAVPANGFGRYAGPASEVVHIARTLPKCIVCTARDDDTNHVDF